VERGEDMNDFYASAKVTVGDSLCLKHEKSQYCSDRVYEATGRGGFLIMPQIDFLTEDFGGALPMYPWGDFIKLEEMIRHYLEHEAERIALTAKTQAITAREHTYINRVQTILKEVGLS
jgi:spore maturation protein CgeB